MRNIFLFFYFICFSSFAQQAIFETKLDKLNSNISYTFNSKNELYLMFSKKKVGLRYVFNSVKKLEDNMFKDILKDEEFTYFFPLPDTNNFLLLYEKPFSTKETFKFYSEGSKPAISEMSGSDFNIFFDIYDSFVLDYENICFDLSDKYVYNIVVNKNNKIYETDNRIENDQLSLLKYDYKTFKYFNNKIDKPNITRLKNDTLYKQKVIAYLPESIDRNTFHIVTKSVEKEGKSSKFYRTLYNLDGKKLNDIEYNIEPIYGAFHFLANDYTSRNRLNSVYNKSVIEPAYDLDLNSHYLDPSNGDFYIFGGTQNKKNPLGFYVYKFDKENKLVWKNYYKIDDKKGFGEKNNSSWTAYSLQSINFSDENILFIAKGPVSYNEDNSHIFKIDKKNGNIASYNMLSSKTKSSLGGLTSNYYSLFDTYILSDRKFCNYELLVAQELNPEIKKFVNSIPDKKGKDKKQIHAKIKKGCIYVFETDNESYYNIFKF